MEIKEAQKKVDENIQELGGYWEPLSMFAAVAEETGELGRELNQLHGGKKKKSGDDGKGLKEEIGDLTHSLFALATGLGVDIEEALLERMEKKVPRDKQTYK